MNPHERYHRARKVTALADTIWAHLSDAERCDPGLAARLREEPPAWREDVAHRALVKVPSETTWEALCERMAELVDAERGRRMVGPGTKYRTLDGKIVVGTEDTHYCRDCDGSGQSRGRACHSCEGSGRLLGADPYVWPVPVEVVEDSRGGGVPGLREGEMPANNRQQSPPPLSAA